MTAEKTYELREVVWEITRRCNLNCQHCGSAAGVSRMKELSSAEITNVCSQLAEMRPRHVNLIGGEVFLRREWQGIASELLSHGVLVTLITNGTIVPIKEVVGLNGMGGLAVSVSIDGGARCHDALRGCRGSCRQAWNAVRQLTSHGLAVSVITTITPSAFGDLKSLRNRVFSSGALSWQLQVPVLYGRARGREDLALGEEQLSALAGLISNRWREAIAKGQIVLSDTLGYMHRTLAAAGTGMNVWSGCRAGITVLGIDSSGFVYGCLALQSEQFVEGNLRERSLREIWRDHSLFAYSRASGPLVLGPHCRGCCFAEVCRGGCSALSHSMTGLLHNAPLCVQSIYASTQNGDSGFSSRCEKCRCEIGADRHYCTNCGEPNAR